MDKIMMDQQPVYLGIDISKGYADFILLDAAKRILEEGFTLDDTLQGRQRLAKLIEMWFAGGITHLYCGVESTGGYENNWFGFLGGLAGFYRLQGKTLKVARLNPKAVKHCGQAGMVRTQTDQTSAHAIASYLIGWPEKVLYSPRNPHSLQHEDTLWLQTRQHVKLVSLLIKQRTQLANQLEKLLYQYLGELLIYCRRGIPQWLLRLVVAYPGREQLLQAGPKKVAAIKGISTDKAASLLNKLDTSHLPASPMSGLTIAATASQILHLYQQIKAQEKVLIQRLKDHRDVQLLVSIKGIGMASAVRLMVEIEDVARFDSVRKLCAYFGVHPCWKQSGDGVWKMGMSKQGRSPVRATLYMCGISAICHNPDLKHLYHTFRKKGMNHYQAMGVIMHKLLRIVYGVLKNQTPYDPDIDRKNRKNAEQNHQKYEQRLAETNKQKQSHRQRFMEGVVEAAEQAPISRRAWQKRRQEASQSSPKEEYAGSPPAD